MYKKEQQIKCVDPRDDWAGLDMVLEPHNLLKGWVPKPTKCYFNKDQHRDCLRLQVHLKSVKSNRQMLLKIIFFFLF